MAPHWMESFAMVAGRGVVDIDLRFGVDASNKCIDGDPEALHPPTHLQDGCGRYVRDHVRSIRYVPSGAELRSTAVGGKQNMTIRHHGGWRVIGAKDCSVSRQGSNNVGSSLPRIRRRCVERRVPRSANDEYPPILDVDYPS